MGKGEGMQDAWLMINLQTISDQLLELGQIKARQFDVAAAEAESDDARSVLFCQTGSDLRAIGDSLRFLEQLPAALEQQTAQQHQTVAAVALANRAQDAIADLTDLSPGGTD